MFSLTIGPPFDEVKARSLLFGRDPRPRDFAQLNIDFFRIIMRLSDNLPLGETSERYFFQTSRIWQKSIPHLDFRAEVTQFCHEIADIPAAVHLGDLESVGNLRRAHMSMSCARLILTYRTRGTFKTDGPVGARNTKLVIARMPHILATLAEDCAPAGIW